MTNQARIEALCDEDKKIFNAIVDNLLDTLESDEGCAVVTADPKGDGVAFVIAAGNQLLVHPLCRMAMRVADQIYDHDPDGAVH